MNKVILIGRLGKDVELKYIPNGNAVANFTVATNENWKDKNGQKQEKTEWHRIVVWGKSAENCNNYIAKGSQVFIEGKLQTRTWEDKQGKKNYTTEIIASNVQFLDTKKNQGANNNQNKPDDLLSQTYNIQDSAMYTVEDIPF